VDLLWGPVASGSGDTIRLVMKVPRSVYAFGILILMVSTASALLTFGVAGGGGGHIDASSSPTLWLMSPSAVATETSTAEIAATPTAMPTPAPTAAPTFRSAFIPIDLLATPTPAPPKGALPTDQVDSPAPRRPIPVQSAEWLNLKAAGRIALVDGRVITLDEAADPLVDPVSGERVPAARMLETSYARWIVEPLGYGKDAKGNTFSNKNYWNLCEAGATTAALYYWQQATGRPDVTGTAGYFLDPYEAEGVAWPSPGPTLVKDGSGKHIGTYWSGSDRVNGFTAHARGYMMYISMEMQPPGWQSKGQPVYATIAGKPLYPTIGAPRTSIQVALNWEASGKAAEGWAEYWYASVMRFEPTAARDLQMAVMLDVGRDGVPVVVELDTHGLPNWQAGAKTPHIRHAVTIVGYDNTAKPPTYTYIDTCGYACNPRGGNQNGKLHVVSQAQMVAAMQDTVGSGFVW
jgi:hypothetical protein